MLVQSNFRHVETNGRTPKYGVLLAIRGRNYTAEQDAQAKTVARFSPLVKENMSSTNIKDFYQSNANIFMVK